MPFLIAAQTEMLRTRPARLPLAGLARTNAQSVILIPSPLKHIPASSHYPMFQGWVHSGAAAEFPVRRTMPA
jgi:hypothetical protein